MHRPTPPPGPRHPDDTPGREPACSPGGLLLGVTLLVVTTSPDVELGAALEHVAAAVVVADFLRDRRT